MLFPTVTFAVFFVVVLATTALLRRRPVAWKLSLIVVSGVFYAWWDERFVLLLAASILANTVAASAIVRWPRWSRLSLALGIATNVIVLGFFKYYGFLVTSLQEALEPVGLAPSLPLLEIALPIGISFFTFEAIAYLIEVRRGDVERMTLLDFATYLSFFPKLVSGPITRASQFAPQLLTAPRQSGVESGRAFWLIARGLIKKVVIASFLADALADDVFATPGQFSAGEVLVGIYAYTAQIYVDFSAYTDMAIGLALLLGIQLPENFRAPYTATSIADFWNRWHLSLSYWIRDFLFHPLAQRARRSRLAVASVQVLVMLLVGLWHGAAWTFVVWGGIHGVALAAARLRKEWRRSRRKPRAPDTMLRRVIARVVTFHIVAFAWVFFRADSVGVAFDVLARLGEVGAMPSVSPLLVATLFGVLLLQYVPTGWAGRVQITFARSAAVLQAGALGLVLLFVDALGPQGVPAFIYFRF